VLLFNTRGLFTSAGALAYYSSYLRASRLQRLFNRPAMFIRLPVGPSLVIKICLNSLIAIFLLQDVSNFYIVRGFTEKTIVSCTELLLMIFQGF